MDILPLILSIWYHHALPKTTITIYHLQPPLPHSSSILSWFSSLMISSFVHHHNHSSLAYKATIYSEKHHRTHLYLYCRHPSSLPHLTCHPHPFHVPPSINTPKHRGFQRAAKLQHLLTLQFFKHLYFRLQYHVVTSIK